jgi:hypothetical protein
MDRRMRKPHVEYLVYSASPENERVEYQAPPPQEFEIDFGRFRLMDGELKIWPRERFGSSGEARAAVQPFLDAWEATADLDRGVGELRFRFKSASLSSTGEGYYSNILTGKFRTLSAKPDVIVREDYPPHLPYPFNAESEIVRDLLARYRQHARGQEPEQSMANAVLTRVLQTGKHDEGEMREQAASRYRIAKGVLSKLSELVSGKYGTPETVRKFDKQDPPTPMSQAQAAWLKAVIPAIVRQVAAVEAGATPDILSMASLPPLASEQGGMSDADDTA